MDKYAAFPSMCRLTPRLTRAANESAKWRSEIHELRRTVQFITTTFCPEMLDNADQFNHSLYITLSLSYPSLASTPASTNRTYSVALEPLQHMLRMPAMTTSHTPRKPLIKSTLPFAALTRVKRALATIHRRSHRQQTQRAPRQTFPTTQATPRYRFIRDIRWSRWGSFCKIRRDQVIAKVASDRDEGWDEESCVHSSGLRFTSCDVEFSTSVVKFPSIK
jgi:hypothetical protein